MRWAQCSTEDKGSQRNPTILQIDSKSLTSRLTYDKIRRSFGLSKKVIQMSALFVVNIVVVVASVLLIGYKEAIAAGRAM